MNLRSIANKTIVANAANRYSAKHKHANADSIMLCPAPVPEANRGDQALLAVALEELKTECPNPIEIVATSWHPIESVHSSETVNIVADLHSVFATPRAFRERMQFLKRLVGKRALVLIGADVLDEGYSVARSEGSLFALEMATRVGVPTRIVSFSVNGTSSSALDERLRRVGQHTQLFARDPVTYRRLKEASVENVVEAGDLAYLLKPADEHEIDPDLLAFLRENHGNLVGLNLTSVVMEQYGEQENRLARLAEAVATLAELDGLRFLLIPHDEPAGVEYMAGFSQRLEQLSPGIARVVTPLPHARVLKRVAGFCRHVFTCRMHLGIAAMGTCTPITCFPYQGKFEGQFELFGLSEDGLIDADKFPTTTESMVALMRDRIAQSEAIASLIEKRLPTVQNLAHRCFEGL